MLNTPARKVMAGVVGGVVIVGGGALVAAPASALSATNWSKIWRTEIKPRADKRYVTSADARSQFAAKSSLSNYYTKASANAIFASQDGVTALLEDYATKDDLTDFVTTADLQSYVTTDDLADYYTKAQSDAAYAAKSDLDSYYTKAQSDSNFAAKGDLDSYYTKAQSDSNYAAKGDLGNYYTKTQSDSSYAKKGDSYTKAESDAKYAPAQSVLKGTFYVVGQNFTDGTFALFSGDVSYGATLSAAPTVHVVAAVDTPPAACGGASASATNPTALAGQLCVFLRPTQNVNPGSGFQIVDPTTTADPGASKFGFGIRVEGDGTLGHVAAYGSWAVGQ